MIPQSLSPATSDQLRKHHAWFLLLWVLSFAPAFGFLKTLVSLSLSDDKYSHIVLIPLISAYLIVSGRQRIFVDCRYWHHIGIPLALMGLVVHWLGVGLYLPLGDGLPLSIAAFGIIIGWIALFALCYGQRSTKAASFALTFLFLMIPIPTVALDNVIVVLREGSADMAVALFRIGNIEVFRQEFILSLAGLNIEIAEECSGIRSFVGLFLSAVLAGHILLQSRINKILLCLLMFPVAIFKNACRIVTISWLAANVDEGFLYGHLHQYGGWAFSLFAVAILAVFVILLKQAEQCSSWCRRLTPVAPRSGCVM